MYVHIALPDNIQDEAFDEKYPNYINYKIYDPDDNDTAYNHELALSPNEAILIGIRLIEAAIPLVAEDKWDELREDIKSGNK